MASVSSWCPAGEKQDGRPGAGLGGARRRAHGQRLAHLRVEKCGPGFSPLPTRWISPLRALSRTSATSRAAISAMWVPAYRGSSAIARVTGTQARFVSLRPTVQIRAFCSLAAGRTAHASATPSRWSEHFSDGAYGWVPLNRWGPQVLTRQRLPESESALAPPTRYPSLGPPGAPAPSQPHHATITGGLSGTQAIFLAPDCPRRRRRVKGALRATLDPAPAHRALAAIRKMAPDQDPAANSQLAVNWRAGPRRRGSSRIRPDVAAAPAAPPPAAPDRAASGMGVCTSVMAAASTHRYIVFVRGSGYPARHIPAHLDPSFT